MSKPSPFQSIDRAAYDAIPAVNWSTLKHIHASPLEYRYRLDNPKEDTDSMRTGRATHVAVFEPECFDTTFAVWGGAQRRGKDWEAFQETHQGKDIITLTQMLGAHEIARAVHTHPLAKNLLKKGKGEQTLTWTDPETGIACKCRIDWVTARTLVDLKTSADIEQRQFGRSFGALLSHWQLGFQSLGLQAHKIKRAFKLIAVESSPPFDCVVYTVDSDALYAGEELARECLRKLAECRAAKKWPGRYTKTMPLDLPPWYWPEGEQEERRELLRLEGVLL